MPIGREHINIDFPLEKDIQFYPPFLPSFLSNADVQGV